MTMASAHDFKPKPSLRETRRRRFSPAFLRIVGSTWRRRLIIRRASVWNGMIDKRPAMIAYCAKPSDVVESISFARETGLSLAVRAGGHNIAGKSLCEDGLVLDLSRMRRVAIDSETRRRAPRAAPCSPISTSQVRRMAWRQRRVSTATPGSSVSRSAAASAGSGASTG